MAISVYNWTKDSGNISTSFDAWVGAQGSTPRSLAIGSDVTITGNLTLPSTIDITTINNGAKFTGTGKTLTINKMSAQPRHQIFDTGLNVLFASGATTYILPEWFGSGNGNVCFGSGINTPLSKVYVEGGVAIGTNLTAGSGNLYVAGSGAFTGVVHGAAPTVDTHLTTKLYVDTASGALDTRITNSGTYAANISGQLNTRINNSGGYSANVSGQLSTRINDSGAYSANVSGQLDARINATGLYATNTSGQLNSYITNTSGQLSDRINNFNHTITSGYLVKATSTSGIINSNIRESGNYIFSSGIIVFPKASGNGIMVDTVNPTYGWRDITSDIHIEGTAALQPTWAQYTGVFYAYQFGGGAAADQCFINFHIPHDYKLGSDLYIHTHWSNNAVSSGNAQWNFDVMYASGHGVPSGFSDAFQTHSCFISGVQSAPSGAYGHMICDIPFTSNGGVSGLINRDLIAVDGIVATRVSRGGTGSADTLTNSPFLHFVDLHYQSTNMPTKQKAPNFYI